MSLKRMRRVENDLERLTSFELKQIEEVIKELWLKKRIKEKYRSKKMK